MYPPTHFCYKGTITTSPRQRECDIYLMMCWLFKWAVQATWGDFTSQ